MAKVGWLSVVAVFGTFFFMSIMFPTIFALGIFGLGPDSRKKASAFIVMSITGGALMPKLMGRLGDVYNMSISFLMPLVCFALIALYGYTWSKLSRAENLAKTPSVGGH
jgi:FHS family L-fucose permease-like MFS transporter